MSVGSTESRFPTSWLVTLTGAAIVVLATVPVLTRQPDPSRVVGPVACAECHTSETKIWENTAHFSTFRELPRQDEAMEIANKMGFKRIKAGSLCLECHFLTQEVDGEREAVAGISCESCHGAGSEYLDVHSANFDPGSGKAGEESAAEAEARRAAAEAAGMIRPTNLYEIASNCYGCHVVPNERLVNVGGHAAGSPFELVSWSQGEVRHNTWHTDENEFASAERLRMMYVVGTAVELETALRATAKATEKAKYGVAMARRADAARKRMAAIADAVSDPRLEEISKIANGASLKLNNEAELSAAADKVASLTKKFVAASDGSKLAAIDEMIPGRDEYKGQPAQVGSR